MTHVVKKSTPRLAATVAFAAACAAASGAFAQTMSTNSAEFNGGWRRIQGTENGGINVRTRDEFGNRVIVDGIIQDGSDNSEFVDSDAWGNGSVNSGSGVGFGRNGATAIGNNLQVITTGNWNTVIVNSTQINNGNVTATSNGTTAPQTGSKPNG